MARVKTLYRRDRNKYTDHDKYEMSQWFNWMELPEEERKHYIWWWELHCEMWGCYDKGFGMSDRKKTRNRVTLIILLWTAAAVRFLSILL